MIRLAQPLDYAQLKPLWSRVFGDSAQAVDAHFALRHRDEDMLVWAEDERICGMLTMLPLTIMQNDAAYPARDIYAVATAPERRGRGIAGELLERAGELILARGEAAAVLVPASKSLFDYYEKRGYRTAFALNVVDADAGALPPCSDAGTLSPCASADYTRIRDRAFAQAGLYARWDERAVDYALGILGEGGGAARLTLGGGEGVAAWSREDDCVLVRELALLGIDVPAALALLHRAVGAPSYRVRLPAGAQPNAEATPFGMIRWFIPEPAPMDAPGYLSLALD
ncbi:MAG: GNAT family N-acetyltransferase [Christensenellaceae bacterium]|nr:GNAT family N-acetyltransferase [Christensenellaceae bacterium]